MGHAVRRSRLILFAVGAAIALGVAGWFGFSAKAQADEARRRDELFYAASWDLDHGQPGQAIEKLKALAQVDPTRKALSKQLGRALVSNGRASEGVATLRKALAEPGSADDPEAFEYLGVAQSQLGSLAEAIASLERSVELDGTRSTAWRRLAQVRLTAGKSEGAVAAWKKAIEAAPAEAVVTRLEAHTLLSQAGKSDEAKQFSEGAP